MIKFSANLGFLFKEFTLPEAIMQAKKYGFDAVECHWPYDISADEVKQALTKNNLEMLGLNTIRGQEGENGLSALVGREDEAQVAIDQSIAYADAIGCKNVHTMAGFAKGEQAEQTFIHNLQYACAKAKPLGITIFIEPLNHYDAPNYFLQTSSQAKTIIEKVGFDNIKLMFDCYHIQLMEGNLTHRLQELLPIIGHIQFASVPDRSEPHKGEINYSYIFEVIKKLGYDQPLGAEYKPSTTTIKSLEWLKIYKK